MRRMFSKNQLAQEVQNVVSSGELENVKVFENIVDKDGHNRFIEGTNVIKESLPEGLNITYNKWSLSGSHLLIVIAGTIANTTAVSGQIVTDIPLPQWVKDKIYPVYSNVVDAKTTNMYNSTGGIQSLPTFLYKISTTKLRIDVSSVTLNADRTFRIAFDLLIDNE